MSTPNRYQLVSDKQRRHRAYGWFLAGALIASLLYGSGLALYLMRPEPPEPVTRACLLPQKDHEITLFKMDDGKIDCWRFQ